MGAGLNGGLGAHRLGPGGENEQRDLREPALDDAYHIHAVPIRERKFRDDDVRIDFRNDLQCGFERVGTAANFQGSLAAHHAADPLSNHRVLIDNDNAVRARGFGGLFRRPSRAVRDFAWSAQPGFRHGSGINGEFGIHL